LPKSKKYNKLIVLEAIMALVLLTDYMTYSGTPGSSRIASRGKTW